MNIYAIIVTYNAMRRNWADRCLQSLQNSTTPVTAVVIDNGSTDGTREYIPKHYPDAVWLPQERNLGFGQANNIGLRYALEHEADYVLLLNQDASLHQQAVEYMLAGCDKQSIVSPLQLNGDGTNFDEMFRRYSLPKTDQSILYDLLNSQSLKPAYPIGEFAAACWFIPIEIIRSIGGFNPLFFQYGEDRNYYQRLVFHQFHSSLVPKAKMYHDRLVHGNTSVFNKNLFHNLIVLNFTDINISFYTSIKNFIRTILTCLFYKLPHKQYKIGTISKEVVWLISHSRTLYHSRKTEKSKGTNWL